MAEKQEFYKLINDKTKVPRLTPVPQIDHLQNEHLENPLKRFRAQAMKLVKAPPARPKVTDKWKTSVQRISKSFYTDELIKLAKAITVQGLLPEWEENILKLIPKISKRKHIGFVMSTMKEVKQEYLREMQNFTVKTIVNTKEADFDIKPEEQHFKRKISNEDFSSSFDVNSKILSQKYFLSHRLIRSISNIILYNLPKSFINFEKYKILEELHISRLIELMNNDLQRCSLIVQNQCYNEIVRCMLQMNNLKNDKRLPKLLHCAESFMVQQILNSMMNSINDLIEALKESGSCGQLKLRLLCRNDALEIEPSINQIFAGYHQIVDNIGNLAQDLVPLGEWLKISENPKYIKVNLPEWFINKAHDDLQKVFDNKFQSLCDHYESVSVRFSTLCSSSTRKQITRLIAGKKGFEVYCSEAEKFRAYLAEINVMVSNVYYSFGRLNQTSAISDLKENALEIINILIKELIDSHQELNHSICVEFESLESRALAIPDDTKSLFELTDYVSYASKVLVKELETKIQKSVHMLCSLVQIASLSNEHIELNKTTINWLELINPVFSQHNIFCEAKKGELEDELQRKINVLSAEIDAIFPELVIIDDMDDAKRVDDYREFLTGILKKINHIDNQIELINIEEKLFKFPETTFSKVDEIKEVMSSFCSLIHIIYQWQKDNEVWMDGPFEYLNPQAIKQKTEVYLDKITEVHKTYKVKIKSDLTSNKPFKFSGVVDDPDPLQQPAPLKLCWQTLQCLNEFRNYVPLAVCMCNPALEKRHWDEMSTIAGIDLLPNAGTTLRKIIDMDLLKDFEKYETISIGADKELALQQKLDEMIEEWSAISFSMSTSEISELPGLNELSQIEILLEEQFIKVANMRVSYFITPIESKVIDFFQKLCRIRDTIEFWNHVQEQCKYLNSFFSNEIVQEHLRVEVDLYNSLKGILKSMEKSLSSTPTFGYITNTFSILENLKQGKYALELITSKVYDYIEQLRLSFTRLFFMSYSEVIKLLFEYQNLTKKESHIQKCFPSINYIKLDQQLNIFSIIGKGGEELKLQKTIPISQEFDSVTDWLICLNKEVTGVIRQEVNDSIQTFNDELSLQWISNTPAMVIFCIWQIIWTSQIHSYFMAPNLEALKICRNKFKAYKENAQQLLKLNLTRKDRETITSLVILFIHQEEVINLLLDKKIHEDTDFDWKAQIRYYYQEEQVKVMIINTSINYAYEYYSSKQRIIVNTLLTERCYRSVMEAYYQNYFGAVVGFSCVGKTETMKNLSRTLAVPFFMFSGEERQDYNCIGNIFKGLVTFEAWVCFKNFTRIREEVLSVIAQYIFRISQSRSMLSNTINIDGTQLNFNPSCYISFSMNPATPKLSDLPDNLKLHFRTVCFMNPDFEKICQVELFSAGFNDAKYLAMALTEVYSLCNDQMSSKNGYDFKLRNLKCVIETAAKLKFIHPDEEEQILLLRSLIDINMSQFIENDIIIFQNILNKSFAGVTLPPPNYVDLLKALEKICESKKLSNHNTLKLKTIQLYEMVHLRQAIILAGEPFSGKSTTLRILKEALLLIKEKDNQDNIFKISCEIISPGALDVDRLYGCVDQINGDWNDGICSNVLRNFTENDNSTWKWLIFDGNMHYSWIEKLETVVDDNKTLFLTSNERITLTNETKIFFETSNLQNVSPSTISRCGILHFDSQTPGWRPLLSADILRVEQFHGYQNLIYMLFDWTIDPCLEFIHDHCTVNLALTNMHLVMSTLDLFKMYVINAIQENVDKKDTKEKDTKDHIAIWSQAAIIMATNWSLAGALNCDSREKFEEFYISLWNNSNANHPRPNEIKQFEISLPADGKLQDNVYMFKGTGNWKHCGDIVKTEKIKEDTLFQEPFIPTVDSVKLRMLLNLHIKYRKPFILCGESSSGKTSFFQDYLTSLSESEYVTNYFNFNSVTESDRAQELFLSKFNKIKPYSYGPPNGRYCINLVDDLNVASANQLNTNSTLELIRQYMDYGFWYDLKHIQKTIISNTLLAGSITTGRENLTKTCPRFLRHFNVLTIHPQQRDSIFRIFSNTLLIDLKKNSFATDVLSSVHGIANATVEVYLAAVQELRPTPSKILYRFSMRDVYRIIKGCRLIQKESVETKITFIRLWAHETFRVLGDRITDDEDKQWLFLKMRECVKLHFKDPFESVFDYLPKYENDEITKESFKDLAFGNFMDADKSKRKYEEINSYENLKNKFLQYIKEYNESSKRKIDIVMTCHVVHHLVRLCRILAIPGENLLMISSSGSGRKSVTRLAAYIQQQSLFEPMIDTQYSENAWKDDIKSLMLDCGTLKKDCTFLITDRQMRPEIVRDINDMLSFGDVSRLFSADERREIIKTVRLDAQRGNRNLEIDMSKVFDYFLDQCRKRLHFILNVSPTGKTLRDYLRQYPTLIDYCTINWFDCWPEKALEQVATQYMKDVNMQDSIKCQVTLISKHFYCMAKQISNQYYEETGKTFHITPAAFIRTTKMYVNIVSKKQEEIKSTRKRYLTGLDKLQLAACEVAQMKSTLTKLRPQLEASARQTEATMKEIESENISVERATVLVKRDEEIANKKAEIAGILKAECEAELAVAIPILEDALSALNTLKPTDITLVKAMKNPPDTVKLVMAAVCVMLNVSSERVVDPVTGRKSMDFWGPSKRVLGDMNFLQNLKDYDKDNISPPIMAIIKKTYMSDKNFMPHIVAKASSAAEGLCKWVRAMVSYDEVAKVVAPKKEKLVAAQKECDETEAFLNAKRKTLADLNIKLAALKSTLEATLLKKLELEREVENCTLKLKKAEDLIASLGGEKTRWMDSSNNLGRLYDNLAGDALLSSAMITYLSSLSLTYRERNISEWKEFMKTFDIPFSEEYDFINFLGIEIKINTWHLSGLSNNQFSLQNALIMENSPLWCLFIDPQTQANEWIKKMEKPNNLQVVKMTDPNYMEVIRNSLEVGSPVLLENLEEELDVSLDPILTRDIYKVSETWYMDLGQDSVLYRPTFRFYLTTRHHNPCYSADVFNKVTVTNFLLPSDALRDRLLDIVISRERPELQEKFEKILVENINNKRILKQQEDNILHTLSASSANILEDEGAIKILDSSKSVAIDLLKRQEATRITKEEIDAFRETYSQFTKYCADLYSTLNILPNLNYMYRFSLSWFTQLYIKSIETSNRSVIHKKRIDYLKMSSIQNLHQSVHNALFEKHKLIYSFILCAKTLLDTEQVTEQEFNVFMSIDGKSLTRSENESAPNAASSWLPDKSWKEICRISNSLAVFQSFANSFSTNNTKWRKYCNSIDYDECLMPSPWDNKLSPFQKLIIIRILCPDKIIFKITEFVESVMGQSSSSFIPCNISRPYAESSCLTPLIFILPSYSSPFTIVNKFAKVLGYSEKLHSLSMGPSQGQKAEFLIEMARNNGEWVFLHNCHLALPWMMKLEKMCEEFDISNTSLGFRLWMSTQSNDKFPIGLLQNSIKIAFDSPYDIKQTLTWTYKSEPVKDKEFFEGCPGKDKAFSKLLYGFCLFHAVIRERKNFGFQSWNFQYDFDEADLHMSIIQLKNWINQCDKVPFKALTYFLSECNYGGKIMDIQDKIYVDNLVIDYCNYKVTSDSNYDFDTVHAYRVPKRIEYRDYLKHIKNSVPASTSPEEFCLDKNVALIRNSNKVRDFLNSLSCLNETAVIHDIESKSNQAKSIILEILEIIPENFNIKEVQEKYVVTEPLNCVLIEEIKMYNKCLDIIRNSIHDLKNAFSGYLIWTERLEEMSEEILEGVVPNSWKMHVSLCTNKILSKFVTDLLERVKFMNSWINNGHPRFYWFGGLMSCGRLLSTMKMIFAREKQVPIDQVAFDFNVLDIKNPTDDYDVPDNAICVYGLYLLGAKWNEQAKSLSSSRARVFYNDMPVVSFELTLKKPANSVNSFKCPLYVSPNLHNSQCNTEALQDNYILSVNLKSDVNPKIWIKRGTALYCQAE